MKDAFYGKEIEYKMPYDKISVATNSSLPVINVGFGRVELNIFFAVEDVGKSMLKGNNDD